MAMYYSQSLTATAAFSYYALFVTLDTLLTVLLLPLPIIQKTLNSQLTQNGWQQIKRKRLRAHSNLSIGIYPVALEKFILDALCAIHGGGSFILKTLNSNRKILGVLFSVTTVTPLKRCVTLRYVCYA